MIVRRTASIVFWLITASHSHPKVHSFSTASTVFSWVGRSSCCCCPRLTAVFRRHPTSVAFSSTTVLHTTRGGASGDPASFGKGWLWRSSPTQPHRSLGGTARTGTVSSTADTDVITTAAANTDPSNILDKMAATSAAEKLQSLRARMKELDLDVWIVPTDDPHLSEYVPEAYKRREFLTGFKGSAGTAIVTADQALLWTDSRYWNEATLQLDAECWSLMKSGLPATPTITKWLADWAAERYSAQAAAAEAAASNNNTSNVRPVRIGMDPFVHAASFAKELVTALEDAAKENGLKTLEKKTATIATLETGAANLVDEIWSEARPPVPTSPFRVHPIEFAGVSLPDKIALLRKEMKIKKATMTVLCTLDDVAYFLNVRCKGDIETCPVGIAYVSVTNDQVTLYCDVAKLVNIQDHLDGLVVHKPYDTIVDAVKEHCEACDDNKVWLDTSRANYALSVVIPEDQLLDCQNPITPMKACKNKAELEGMRRAHVVDGVAMAKFMVWLETTIQERSVSEVEIDEKLTGFRGQQPGFCEVSFPTIAGVGSNGAIVHYRAHPDSDLLKYLDTTRPILIDSGGQYTYGTTDVTRTWHFGEPTEEFRDCYTRVLKGHIGVDQMVFPEGTPGFVLDVFARQWLWVDGKDYGHGTGHGVGAALNVHEGPMSISPRWTNKEGLKKGMVVSNEPGYYEDGNFGIRIENLLEIRYVEHEYNEEAEQPPKTEEEEPAKSEKSTEKKYLRFSPLTMIPIQKSLINVNLMTDRELDWLDSYHDRVWNTVSPHLDVSSPEWLWLKRGCAKIDRKNSL